MPPTRGITPRVAASLASSSWRSPRRLGPSGAIRKPISSSIPRCVAPCFGGFRTRSSSKSAQSMARATRKVGADAGETHNNTLDRPDGSPSLTLVGQRVR
jgi:hypothetical protein